MQLRRIPLSVDCNFVAFSRIWKSIRTHGRRGIPINSQFCFIVESHVKASRDRWVHSKNVHMQAHHKYFNNWKHWFLINGHTQKLAKHFLNFLSTGSANRVQHSSPGARSTQLFINETRRPSDRWEFVTNSNHFFLHLLRFSCALRELAETISYVSVGIVIWFDDSCAVEECCRSRNRASRRKKKTKSSLTSCKVFVFVVLTNQVRLIRSRRILILRMRSEFLIFPHSIYRQQHKAKGIAKCTNYHVFHAL